MEFLSSLVQQIRHEFFLKISHHQSIARDLCIPDLKNKIKVIIGMRRTGKTYYLLEKAQRLLKEGTDYSNILYFNLEDDRLRSLHARELAQYVDQFYALYPKNHDQLCYLFFDEIQNIEGWSRFIRRLHDTKNVNIYLTGSSAKLLSKEIATELRGRSLAYEMWPFSFSEYCRANKIEPASTQSQIDRDRFRETLTHYLFSGGFPEIILLPLPEKNRILQDYVDVVIYRDIVERYHITNYALIKYMIKYLIKNFSTRIAMNKLYHDLKSQGFSVGRSTVYDYLEYIHDAYLVFMVPLYTESVRKMQSNPRKIYSIDTGLSKAYLFNKQNDWGRLFENMVYLDLKRRGDEIYYYQTQENHEIDFLTRSLDGNLHLYQVAWEMEDPATAYREKTALAQAEKELGIKGKVITPENYRQAWD